MGNKESTLDKGIQFQVKSEFERVKNDKNRKYLLLSEVLNIQHPEEYPFTFSHFGNLFVLNKKRDGKVSLEELMNFALFCSKNLKNYKTHEFQSQLQAATTLELCSQFYERENLEDELVNWMGKLLYENEQILSFFNVGKSQEIPFLKLESVKLIYEVPIYFTLNYLNIIFFKNFQFVEQKFFPLFYI